MIAQELVTSYIACKELAELVVESTGRR